MRILRAMGSISASALKINHSIAPSFIAACNALKIPLIMQKRILARIILETPRKRQILSTARILKMAKINSTKAKIVKVRANLEIQI